MTEVVRITRDDAAVLSIRILAWAILISGTVFLLLETFNVIQRGMEMATVYSVATIVSFIREFGLVFGYLMLFYFGFRLLFRGEKNGKKYIDALDDELNPNSSAGEIIILMLYVFLGALAWPLIGIAIFWLVTVLGVVFSHLGAAVTVDIELANTIAYFIAGLIVYALYTVTRSYVRRNIRVKVPLVKKGMTLVRF